MLRLSTLGVISKMDLVVDLYEKLTLINLNTFQYSQ